MQYSIVAPEKLRVVVTLPASKSISNRALIMHALSGRPILPQNLSNCDDTRVMVRALTDMPKNIDVRAAGTAMRFMTAYLSCRKGEHTLTGTQRMRQRPIKPLVEALRYLGAKIEYEAKEGYPPIRIYGKPLEGGNVEMPGGISSQFISALLMIGPSLKKGLELKMTGQIASRPYIDLTLCMMREYGAKAEWTDIDAISVKPGQYNIGQYTIESDWSAASYWYEMVALSNDPDATIELEGLSENSKQGDSVVRHIFSLLGVKTVFSKHPAGQLTKVTLKKLRTRLPKLEYDFVNSPDLAQTLVVTCAMMGVPFYFKGLSSLRIKETDRIEALKKEMAKLGFVLREMDEGELAWDGMRCRPSDEAIDTYEDHRMALAFAPVALVNKEVKINQPGVVSKSYPQFWSDLRQSGFEINER